MANISVELGRIMFGIVATTLFGEMLRSSGRSKPDTQRIGEEQMDDYDLIGHDDDYGSIGQAYEFIEGDEMDDIIGEDDDDDDDEDESLLESLAIEGAGDTELIGARRRRRRGRKSSKSKSALRRIAMRNAGAVLKRRLSRRRRYPLGFLPTNIATLVTSAPIPSNPQNLFRPERLVIPSDIAFDIGVTEIKVGNMSQLVQSVELPAALFSEVAINTGVTFDTAEVGNQVSVTARNKSAATIEFTAGLVGSIAK